MCFDCKVDALLASFYQTVGDFESGVRQLLLKLTCITKTLDLTYLSPDFIFNIYIFSSVYATLTCVDRFLYRE